MYAVYIKTGYFKLSHISTLFILNNPYFTLSSYLKNYNMCILFLETLCYGNLKLI
jgi:hypothetical protein